MSIKTSMRNWEGVRELEPGASLASVAVDCSENRGRILHNTRVNIESDSQTQNSIDLQENTWLWYDIYNQSCVILCPKLYYSKTKVQMFWRRRIKITQHNTNCTASHKSIYKIYFLYEVILSLFPLPCLC